MTKTLTALTALAFAASLCGGALAQTTGGGAMATDKMAADHAMKKDGAMASGSMAKSDGAMKTDAMASDGMKKKAKKKAKAPMAGESMAAKK